MASHAHFTHRRALIDSAHPSFLDWKQKLHHIHTENDVMNTQKCTIASNQKTKWQYMQYSIDKVNHNQALTKCAFIFAYYSILMLSSHAYYPFEINLLFSNYAEKFISTQTKYLNFYVCACSEQRPTHNYITFSCGEGFKASLLFSLV